MISWLSYLKKNKKNFCTINTLNTLNIKGKSGKVELFSFDIYCVQRNGVKTRTCSHMSNCVVMTGVQCCAEPRFNSNRRLLSGYVFDILSFYSVFSIQSKPSPIILMFDNNKTLK